jgi:hypothetical protein
LKVFRTRSFDRRAKRAGVSDDDVNALIRALVERPSLGDVIPGCAGARKVRLRLPGRGKRGGARVIYAVVLRATALVLLDVYAKNERADLTADERRTIAALIREIETGPWP